MMKLKPFLLCSALLLVIFNATACHENNQQSDNINKTTQTTKQKKSNVKKSSTNPLNKTDKKKDTFSKETTTNSNVSKALSSAPVLGNPIKEKVLNYTVEKALDISKQQDDEVEKPEYLTLEDIKKEEKPATIPLVINQQTESIKPTTQPNVSEENNNEIVDDVNSPIVEPSKDNNETIEPPIIETVPILTLEQPIIYINEGEDLNINDYVKVTDVQDALVELKVPLTELHQGENQITVTATNRFGNTATAILTVIVNAKPIMTLTKETLDLKLGDSFLPQNYVSVVDKEDGDITDNLVITNPVQTDKAGSYQVIYEVKDSKGLSVTKNLIVHVIDPDNIQDSSKDTDVKNHVQEDEEKNQLQSDLSEKIEDKNTDFSENENQNSLDLNSFNFDTDIPLLYTKVS